MLDESFPTMYLGSVTKTLIGLSDIDLRRPTCSLRAVAKLGRMAFVTDNEEGWLCGTGCFLVRVRRPFVDNRFLSQLFSTEPLVRWLSAHAAGAIMPNLNNVVLGLMPVFLPSISEQREIVAILDAIDSKIDLHRRKLAVLEELFKALLHKLMTGEIRVDELNLTGMLGARA